MSSLSDSLNHQILQLSTLLSQLKKCDDYPSKISLLDTFHNSADFLSSSKKQAPLPQEATPIQEYIYKAIVSLGQAPSLFRYSPEKEDWEKDFFKLLDILEEVETLYQPIGGIIGYHLTFLELLEEKDGSTNDNETIHYHTPPLFDISEETPEVTSSILKGIQSLPDMAEIYPIGGAGDRLNLRNPLTGTPLPAALLEFGGFTLLEGLLRDLIAREYLYFQLYAEQVTTPIAMMTSEIKENHSHILSICWKNHWFGRDPESFLLFCQPLAPVITEEGDWAMEDIFTPILKPGGHGILWELAKREGVFSWLATHERSKVIIRQINNPVGGLDYSLLAFSGIGCSEEKSFGFISCPRRVQAPEGTLILKEKMLAEGITSSLSNIEYPDFAKYHLTDKPIEEGSPYSQYPANTNILFVDLKEIQKVASEHPFPGLLLNMKNQFTHLSEEGKEKIVKGDRLESTMQNISDYITSHFDDSSDAKKRENLKSFLTFNKRIKTLSPTKHAFTTNEKVCDTPESAFYDLLLNARELLKDYCEITLPEEPGFESYLNDRPSFLFSYHPALGPTYSIIAQKIHKGNFSKGSELILEIAEVDIENLDLDGSFTVIADHVTGHHDEEGRLCYSSETGKCILQNVKVRNEGIDWNSDNCLWKKEIAYQEQLKIILHGTSEFHAYDVTIEGNHIIEVPDGHLVVAQEEHGKVVFVTTPLEESRPLWEYRTDINDHILLTRTD